MTTSHLLLTWKSDPFVLGACVIAIALYALFVRRRAGARPAFFGAAIALVVVAHLSPIGVLAQGYLFSAHMLQHLLLVLAVPPLVWMSLPRATSRDERDEDAPKPRFLEPWLLGIGAMWIWHAPVLCDAAGSSVTIQHLQSLTLVAMGGAFWWPILAPRARHRLAPFGAMLYLFTACLGCTILGVVVTFSPVAVCSIYTHPVDRLGVLPLVRDGWKLGPKADQEIGGLMMWVPACAVYLGAILAMLARYYKGEERETGKA